MINSKNKNTLYYIMSIYPCDFNEAWEPLIPPSRPDYFNNQNNEIKKIMKETTYNEIYDTSMNNKSENYINTNDEKLEKINENYNYKYNYNNNYEYKNQNQNKNQIEGGNVYSNHNTNTGDSIHPKYINKQLNKILNNQPYINNNIQNENSMNNVLLNHIKNLEKNMKDLINIVNLHKIENEYKNNTQINDILLYILIGIIIAYIIFTISNRK